MTLLEQNGARQRVLDVLIFQERKKLALNGSKRGRWVYTPRMPGGQNGNPGFDQIKISEEENQMSKRIVLSIVGALLLGMVAVPLLNADGAEHTTFGGGIGVANPCNALGVSATGPVDIVFHANQDGTGVHVNIALQFKASGHDTNGSSYKTSFIANGQFEGAASFYDVPYHAVFIGQGSAPNFAYDGNVRVFVASGQAVGAAITSLSSTCTQ